MGRTFLNLFFPFSDLVKKDMGRQGEAWKGISKGLRVSQSVERVMTKYPGILAIAYLSLRFPYRGCPGWVGQAEGIKDESSGHQAYKSSPLPTPWESANPLLKLLFACPRKRRSMLYIAEPPFLAHGKHTLGISEWMTVDWSPIIDQALGTVVNWWNKDFAPVEFAFQGPRNKHESLKDDSPSRSRWTHAFTKVITQTQSQSWP